MIRQLAMHRLAKLILSFVFLQFFLGPAAPGTAAEPEAIPIATLTRSEPVDFNTEILPILRKHCLACHNRSDADSDLVLESPATIRQGGSDGPAVRPGHGNDSLLIRVAAHRQEPFMPPADNDSGADALSSRQLGLLRLWIDLGAKGKTPTSAAPIAWQPLPADVHPTLALAMTENGRYAACGRGNQLTVYHLPSGHLVQTLSDPALTQTTSSDTTSLLNRPSEAPAANRLPLPPAAHRDLVQSVRFHPDGRLLASGGYETVKLWRRPPLAASVRIDLGLEPTALAVATESRIAAIGTSSGPIWLWDLATQQAIDMLAGHAGRVNKLCWNRQGTRLISAGSDRTLRIWDVARHIETGRLTLDSEVLCLTLAQQQTRLVTGGMDHVVRVWDWPRITAATSQRPAKPAIRPLRELAGHQGPVTALAVLPSPPNQIVSCSRDGTARRWNLENGELLQTIPQTAPVLDVAASQTGHRWIACSADGMARLYSSEDGQLVAQLSGTPQLEFRLARIQQQHSLLSSELAAEKKCLATLEKQAATSAEQANRATAALAAATKKRAEQAQKLASIQAQKQTADQQLKESTAAIEAADKTQQVLRQQQATANGPLANLEKRLAKASNTTTTLQDFSDLLRARQTDQRQDLGSLLTQLEAARARASRQRKQAKQTLAKLAQPIAQQQRQLDQASQGVKQAETSAAQSQREQQRTQAAIQQTSASIATYRHRRQSIQTEMEAQTARLKQVQPGVGLAAFSADGQQLALARENGDFWIYDAQTGTVWDRFRDPQAAAPRGLAPMTNGHYVSIDAGHQLLVWNARSNWQLQRVLTPSQAAGSLVERVLALDFSPDGKWLAAGSGQPSRSGVISLWRVADGHPAWTLADAHSDTVFGLRFSADGNALASSAADRLAKVFHTADGSEQQSFEGHTHHVLDVGWRATGKQLVTAGADGRIKIWSLETGQPIRTIEGFVGGTDHEVTSLAVRGITAEVLTSAGDGRLRIHNMDDGKLLRTLDTGDGTTYGVATDALGKWAITGGRRGTLQLWDLDTSKRLRVLEPAEEGKRPEQEVPNQKAGD